jgi:hypothetical protein
MPSDKNALGTGAEKAALYERRTDRRMTHVERESEGDTNNRRWDWTPLANIPAQNCKR